MIRKIFLRSMIVCFWIALIFGILYGPSIAWLFEKKSINVFAWGDILDPSVVAEFEKTTGIKVNLNFYGSNEEMIVKLKATKGEGYDLIVPSDYSVKVLASEGLLQKLDRSQLTFFPRLHPKLLNHSFDPDNHYSVPFEWELFVLGIDQEFFQAKPLDPSWKMVFDPQLINYRITMPNDPIQTFTLASFYLYGPQDKISPVQLKEITDLLIEQKRFVNAYADFRADYFLATKNSAVVIASTSYLLRTMKKFPSVGFVIPKEGSFMTIENFCIPKKSKKEALAYQLMNFLYSRSSMKAHFETYGIFPAVTDVLDDLNLDPEIEKLSSLSLPSLQKFHFVTVQQGQDKIRDAWVRIKTD